MNLYQQLKAMPLAHGLGLLAFETTLLLSVGLLAAIFMTSPLARRALWQTLFLGLAVLAVLECCGAGAAWLSWRAGPRPPVLLGAEPAPATILSSDSTPVPAAVPAWPAQRAARPVSPGRAAGSGAWLLWLWVFGTLLLLARTLWARVAFAAFVCRRPVADESLLQCIQALRTRLKLRRAVRLTEIDGLTGPIAYGLLRAEISVPPAFITRFTEAQQSAMLAHEVAHLAARDGFWHLLADAFAAFWWWHPLVWMARRRFQEATESAADELSLLVPDGPAALAESLVLLGGDLSRLRIGGGLGVSGKAFRSSLGRRVAHLEFLCHQGRARLGLGRPTLLLARAAALGLAVSLTLTAATLGREEMSEADSGPRAAFQRSLVGILLGTLGQAQSQRAPTPYAGATIPSPGTPSERTPTNPPSQAYVYQIKAGDTLARIVNALRQGGWVITQREILVANPGVEWNRLRVGQKVAIPAPAVAAGGIPGVVAQSSPVPAEIPRPVPAPAAPVEVSAAAPLAAAVPVATEAGRTVDELHTRWFKLDAQALRTSLRDWQQKSPAQAPASSWDLTGELRQFLTVAGVELSAPGRQLAYNERAGSVMVRGTVAELDLVEQAVQIMNTPSPQVMLEVRLCEMPEEAVGSLGRSSPGGKLLEPLLRQDESAAENPGADAALKAILTEPETRTVLRALETRRGVNILSAPKVTTLSGRQAQIKTVRIQSIVTDLDFSTNIVTDSTHPVVTIQPISQPFELGPIIDLFPHVQADQKTVALTVRAQIREFEGYENLSWMQAVVRQGSETRTQLAPLPKFRLREVSASAVVRDGYTLVVAGGSIEEQRIGPRDANLARSPKAAAEARPSASSRSKSRKSLLILITPTLIDSSGNRPQ